MRICNAKSWPTLTAYIFITTGTRATRFSQNGRYGQLSIWSKTSFFMCVCVCVWVCVCVVGFLCNTLVVFVMFSMFSATVVCVVGFPCNTLAVCVMFSMCSSTVCVVGMQCKTLTVCVSCFFMFFTTVVCVMILAMYFRYLLQQCVCVSCFCIFHVLFDSSVYAVLGKILLCVSNTKYSFTNVFEIQIPCCILDFKCRVNTPKPKQK